MNILYTLLSKQLIAAGLAQTLARIQQAQAVQFEAPDKDMTVNLRTYVIAVMRHNPQLLLGDFTSLGCPLNEIKGVLDNDVITVNINADSRGSKGLERALATGPFSYYIDTNIYNSGLYDQYDAKYYYLPYGAPEDERQQQTKDIDVAIVYKDKEKLHQLLSALEKFPIKVFHTTVQTDRTAFSRSKICVNLDTPKDSINNPCLTQIPAARSLLLTPHHDYIRSFFTVNKEAGVFYTVNDLVEKIMLYLSKDQLLHVMISNGFAKVHEFTWVKQIKKFFQFVTHDIEAHHVIVKAKNLLTAGKHQEAEALITQAHQFANSYYFLKAQALLYKELKRYAKALDAVNKAVSIRPKVQHNYMLLSAIYEDMGRFVQAGSIIEKVSRDNGRPHYDLLTEAGRLYFKGNDMASARRCVEDSVTAGQDKGKTEKLYESILTQSNLFQTEKGNNGLDTLTLESSGDTASLFKDYCAGTIKKSDLLKKLKQKKFSSIRISDFFETIKEKDHGKIITLCHDLLKPGGMLTIEVPDFILSSRRFAGARTDAERAAFFGNDFALLVKSPSGLPLESIPTKDYLVKILFETDFVRVYHKKTTTACRQPVLTVCGFKKIPLPAVKTKRPLSVGIQLPVINTYTGAVWGDEVMARGLMHELLKHPLVKKACVYDPYTVHSNLDLLLNLYPHPITRYVKGPFNVWWYQAALSPSIRWDQQKLCTMYDAYFCAGTELMTWLKARGVTNPLFFPMSADSAVYHPVKPVKDYTCDIAFCGNNIRGPHIVNSYFIPLKDKDLRIYGTGWEGLEELKERVKGPLNPADVPALYSSAKIVLSIHTDWHRKNDVPTSRIFEALACGAFVISDRVSSAVKLFKDGMIFVESPEKLVEKVDYYLKNDDERVKIAKKGKELFDTQSGFSKSAQKLLEFFFNNKTCSNQVIL